MTRVTLDASVICKWLLRDAEDEPDRGAALALLDQVATGAVRLNQPPHWLAEVLGVLARRRPERVHQDLAVLLELPIEVRSDDEVYLRAALLARSGRLHLFDTLYHAVALSEPGGVFITADVRYFKAARAFGQIQLLADAASQVREPPRQYLVPRRPHAHRPGTR